MFRVMLRSKIHRATVTEANTNYIGSIGIDEHLLALADIAPYEKVLVADIDNGQRLETYVIPARPGSGIISMNGAAARLVQVGDKIIVMAFAYATEEEVANWQPRIVFVDEANRPISQSEALAVGV